MGPLHLLQAIPGVTAQQLLTRMLRRKATLRVRVVASVCCVCGGDGPLRGATFQGESTLCSVPSFVEQEGQ